MGKGLAHAHPTFHPSSSDKPSGPRPCVSSEVYPELRHCYWSIHRLVRSQKKTTQMKLTSVWRCRFCPC